MTSSCATAATRSGCACLLADRPACLLACMHAACAWQLGVAGSGGQAGASLLSPPATPTSCAHTLPSSHPPALHPNTSSLQLFPYHLGEYVCRQMRLTPFKYYRCGGV